MNITIRQEGTLDYLKTELVTEKAFLNANHSDHTEQFLVARLRKGDAYIPELSLVVELNGKIVGHIMLSKCKIESNGAETDSLALAPVSVLPDYQSKGIGSKLIIESLRIAKELGHKSV